MYAYEAVIGFHVVLNLIINGLPSIHNQNYYLAKGAKVLNLIINGLPSILKNYNRNLDVLKNVLNLIINGLPSIREELKKAWSQLTPEF